MKTLSLLLLLTLGLGAAWWYQSHPGGTLEDARREAATFGARAGVALGHARAGAVDALGLAIGAPSATGDDADAHDAEPTPSSAALMTGSTDGNVDAAAADAPTVGGNPDAAGDAVAVRLAALEAALARSGDGAGSGPAAGGDAVVALRDRLAETERRLDDMAERETRTLDRLGVLDERIVTLADRIDGLGSAGSVGTTAGAAGGDADEAAIDEPGSALVDAPDGEPTAGDDAFADDARQADPIAGRLDTLAAGLDRRLARLEALADAAAADAAAADAAAADAAAADAAAADGSGDRSAADPLPGATDDGDAVSVDATQAAIRDELAEIGEQVDEDVSREDAPALGEALENTREQLATLDARVQAMPDASAATDSARDAQEALQAQVRELAQRLEALAAGDPGIADSISAVREQVDELSSRDFVTQDELRAQVEGRNVEYKIYFDANRTDISEDAARVLDSFIIQERNRTTGVSIFGFTDRRGSASYNQRLALERATNVRSYLIRNGLPYTKIRTLSGLGEDAAAAILPDDADDAQQRVVVLFAAQP